MDDTEFEKAMEFDWFIQLHPMFRLSDEQLERMEKERKAKEAEKLRSDLYTIFIILFCLVLAALIFGVY